MLKKILFLTVCFALVLCFAACKADNSESGNTTVTETQTTVAASGKQNEKQTTEAATKKQSEKSKTTKKSEKSESAKKSDSQQVTKKNSDGTFTLKGVKVDVVKYSGASLDDGKQLIENLTKVAVKNGKVLDKTQYDKSIVYILSGTNTKTNKTQFYKLQYIQDGSVGYLITYTADSREALGKDLSYVTDNYKDLAR